MTRNQLTILAFTVAILTWLNGYTLFSSLCIPLFIVSFAIFISRLPITIPFRELAIMVTTLQLLAASFIAFYLEDPDPIFIPKGNPDDYFTYAVPGVILFAVGLFTFKPKITFDAHFMQAFNDIDILGISKKFILIGWGAIIVLPFIPGSLAYFVVLIQFLSYVGGIMILFTPKGDRKRYLWLALAFLPVIQGALFAGIFFLAMIWMAYLMLYYLYRRKATFTFNMLVIIIGLYAILVTDSAKKDYRTFIDEQKDSVGFSDKALLFSSLFIDNASFKVLSSKANISNRVTRANQGALVTWVMDYTPRVQNFGNGETIKESIIAAIFPRFLMPNKAEAGGKVSFERYTGRKLKGTSMNLSLLGEGWANFGYWGGLFFMFGVGVFYSLSFKLFCDIIKRYPIYFFFIPFIFIYTIKAEDDLLTPLNHIVKASLVLFLLHHIYIKKIITTK